MNVEMVRAHIVGVLVAGLGTACAPARLEPGDATLQQLHQVAVGIGRYSDSLGRLPGAIADVCLANARWCFLDPQQWQRDGWGKSLSYTEGEGTFEVRSAGPDGLENSSDDVTWNSQWAIEQAQRLSGCYEASREPWNGAGTRLSLTMVGDGPWEFRVQPRGTADRAVWFPVPGDRAQVVWQRVPTGVVIDLLVVQNDLQGSLLGLSDFAGVRRRRIELRRVECAPPG